MSVDHDTQEPAPFSLKDCALATLASGKKAYRLGEFRNRLVEIESASIYHHFWGVLLQARFESREYNNDFAYWVRHEIHDPVLAERLAVLDPTVFASLEDLRNEIIELVDARLEEADCLADSPARQPFVFNHSQIVIFDTGRFLQQPEELKDVVGQLSAGSIFYHFIDARRRTSDRRDDFSDWLEAFGDDYTPLLEGVSGIDPYFGSLFEIRNRLAGLFSAYFDGMNR